MPSAYERDDASDSDEDAREARARRENEAFEREVDEELRRRGQRADAGDGTWETFWRRSVAANAAKMRRAGLDPEADDPKEAFGRDGRVLERGKPRDGRPTCFGCERACDETYECAQCLEIYRTRSKKVAFDTWERAFFCSCDCYVASWDVHKSRHGPSTAGPTKLDGQVHEFEAPKGNGALWHGLDLKRMEFEGCVPITY